jgi:ATP-dependent Clp protease ATP-binding subunit ClpB
MNYNPNKFTLRAQEAVQTAAQKAASLQHQQIEPEHVLLALLSDKNNIAYQLSEKLGLQTEQIITILERQIDRFPKVSGASVSGQYLSPNLSKIFDLAATQAEKLKDEYISSEHLFIAMLESGQTVSKILKDAGATTDGVLKALASIRGSQRVTDPTAEDRYNALKKYARDLNELARKGKLDPVIGAR